MDSAISFKDIVSFLSSLNLSIYTPSQYILADQKRFYEKKYDTQLSNKTLLKQSTRESGIMKLMKVNLMKRLESSIESFKKTLNKLENNLEKTIEKINNLDDKKAVFEGVNF